MSDDLVDAERRRCIKRASSIEIARLRLRSELDPVLVSRDLMAHPILSTPTITRSSRREPLGDPRNPQPPSP
jgi:hypothetical protein